MAKLLAIFGITEQQDIASVVSKSSEVPELSETNKSDDPTGDTSKPDATTPNHVQDNGGSYNAVAEEDRDKRVFHAPAQTSDGDQQTESGRKDSEEDQQDGASKASIRGTGEDLEDQHDPSCLREVLSLALNG